MFSRSSRFCFFRFTVSLSLALSRTHAHSHTLSESKVHTRRFCLTAIELRTYISPSLFHKYKSVFSFPILSLSLCLSSHWLGSLSDTLEGNTRTHSHTHSRTRTHAHAPLWERNGGGRTRRGRKHEKRNIEWEWEGGRVGTKKAGSGERQRLAKARLRPTNVESFLGHKDRKTKRERKNIFPLRLDFTFSSLWLKGNNHYTFALLKAAIDRCSNWRGHLLFILLYTTFMQYNG